MSRGRRYEPEGKLNYQKVFAVIIAIAVIIMFIFIMKNVLNQREKIRKDHEFFALYAANKWGVINQDGEEVITSNSGFEFQDMIQDVDAFNLSCGFSFETSPIYDILEQYYITLKSYKRRFQLFKANLINEFDKDTLKEVAEIFSKPDQITITALNAIFGTMFGSYDHDLYGDVMATAFSEKIEYYITGEVNVLL